MLSPGYEWGECTANVWIIKDNAIKNNSQKTHLLKKVIYISIIIASENQ